jgi:cytochrome c oxidase subunit 2
MTYGCRGIQSTLAPAGDAADRVATLFWWMTAGTVVVTLFVLALVGYFARHATGRKDRRRDRWLILGGGVILPTVAVTILLTYGLAMIPETVARAPEGSLEVAVTGEQWWWRVRYMRPGGQPVPLANELRLPVGEPTQFRLESDNVIHSFWIPSLAGKVDMIPGRVTYLTVTPRSTGIFRGACAEYCGTAHALMAFYVEVMPRAEFDRWLAHQAAPAAADPAAAHGEANFVSNGCGACHTIRGTAAAGQIGPDLTHVGSRHSLGAGILENEAGEFHRWLARTGHLKPGVHMPQFGMLPDPELRALAAYLDALK